MGKIDEFEDKIIKQGMSDEDFEEYKKLLKREIQVSLTFRTQAFL